MKIVFLAVGKRNDAHYDQAINDFTQRCSRVLPTDWVVVPAGQSDTIEQLKAEECIKIMSKISTNAYVILLDEAGIECHSEQLASKIQNLQNESKKEVVFIIGGAFGVDERVRNRADFVWSLSKLTFPHQLVRLILSEQVYRAFTILQGSSYHHR